MAATLNVIAQIVSLEKNVSHSVKEINADFQVSKVLASVFIRAANRTTHRKHKNFKTPKMKFTSILSVK